jgi:hypothetical protein
VGKTDGALDVVARSVRDAPIAVHDRVLYWFAVDRPALLACSAEPPFASRIVSADPILERPNALAVDGDGAFVATGHGQGGSIVLVPLR